MKIKCKLGKKRVARQSKDTLPKPPSPVARQLALAYKLERTIEAGELRDYADAAGRLGITGARISQIAQLVNLPAGVQEETLTGRVVASERRLRQHAERVTWPR